ncbi:hypothetical protein JTY60_01550 [symbiont of Argiope bruennichi]|uniref:hypothetical protein n=1 Tax=symbiont of Argiope bruennichi TaxID=2810479 RepID=UPI003DA3F10D
MNYFLAKKEIKIFVKDFFSQKSRKTQKKIIKVLLSINKKTNYTFFNLTDTFNYFFRKNNFFIKKNNFFIYYLTLYGIIFFKDLNYEEFIYFQFLKILKSKLTFKFKKTKIQFKYQKNLMFFNYLDYYLQIFANLNFQNLSQKIVFYDYYLLIYFTFLYLFIAYFHQFLVPKQNYSNVVFLLEILQKLIKYAKKVNIYFYNDFLKRINYCLPKI